jgi:phospholipid/cholesterol/gamma-HCH transport system ATP-binding protein
VEVEGRVVRDMGDDELYRMRRKMGMMFQKSGLFTDLSTFDNIAFPMRERTALPESMIRDLVMMKLHAVGLRGAHRLMPNELSGGMQRRVALARAIALDPMLVMYDEPFAGLDPISLNVIANLIRRLNDALGVTSIVVTYDVVESLKVADYIYFISDGVVAARGTVEEVKTSRDPFVRQFVDCLPDGPVAFHYPASPIAADLRLGAFRGSDGVAR